MDDALSDARAPTTAVVDPPLALFAQSVEHSPMFKARIVQLERDVDVERESVARTARNCETYAESVRVASNADRAFARETLKAFEGASDMNFTSTLERLASERSRLALWIEQIMAGDLKQYVEKDLIAVKEARKKLDGRKREYEATRAKQLSAKTASDKDKADGDVIAMREAFEHSRLDLMLALQRAEVGKRVKLKQSVRDFMVAQMDYHRRAVELLTPLGASFGIVDRFIDGVESENAEIELALTDAMSKLMATSETKQSTTDALSMVSERSREISAQMASETAGYGSSRSMGGDSQTIMQGYLYKRSSGKLVDWKRRFFVLDAKGNLTYVKSQPSKPRFGFGKKSEGEIKETVSLLTSTIKPDLDDGDVRFAFRIVSPEKTYYLRAENQGEQRMWMEAITTAIASLLNSSVNERVMAEHDEQIRRHNRNPSSMGSLSAAFDGPSPLSVLSAVDGNAVCADCGLPEPDWASLNLGVMMCIQCSGVHRQLGVQVSKVRSATLDVRAWEPSVMEFFKRWGNVEANRRWEADAQHKVSKPKPSALVDVKKAYILEKYVARKYCHRGSAPSESALLTAINTNSVPAVMDILLAGCHVKLEYIMLTAACECGDANLAILEILSHYNVNVNAVDDRSKDTALHYAVSKGYDECAKTLLRKGADATMKNFKGATAMDLAVARGGIRDDELLIMLTN